MCHLKRGRVSICSAKIWYTAAVVATKVPMKNSVHSMFILWFDGRWGWILFLPHFPRMIWGIICLEIIIWSILTCSGCLRLMQSCNIYRRCMEIKTDRIFMFWNVLLLNVYTLVPWFFFWLPMWYGCLVSLQPTWARHWIYRTPR